MNALTVTDHAAVRMAQRSIKSKDSDLIAMIGTEVDDGYLVTADYYQRVEREIKQFLARIRRIRGKRLVVVIGQIVTAYHPSRQNRENDLCE